MRISYLSAAALAAVLTAGSASAAPAVTGEYVEARSANVFIGACHYEGEVQTAGRNALMAWKITGGEQGGVSLKGLSVVAVTAGDKHLGMADAQRQTVLYVDQAATAAQREAVVAMLKERAPKALGTVVGVKSAPIRFDSSTKQFQVQVDGVASMKINKQTAETCCKQPYEVWGKPFVPVSGVKTGFGVSVEYKDASLLKAWSANEQNNVFFGDFSL